MALGDYFLTPLGLLALLSLVVLVLLYLISRKPARVRLPTIEFLSRDPKRVGTRPRPSRLRRSLLFFLQALVLVLCALALATPYLPVDAGGGGQAALVVDTSASMATQTGDGTRFTRAIAAARGDLQPTTSVVVADSTPQVAGRRQAESDARATLDTLSVSETAGDLAGAIALGTATVPSGGTVHVYSDFADATDWAAAVETARARGYRVVLHQFADGGTENVGVVDVSFGRAEVTATIRNVGDQPATRTVTLGDSSRSLTLEPGDVTTVTLPVPTGGDTLRLTPGDGFPVDDVVPIGAPRADTIRVVVFTNDRDRYLLTALAVLDGVEVRVESLPASVAGEFDVVVFSGVEPDRLLAGNIALARETLADGGGVVFTAQRNLGAVDYEGLLPVVPAAVSSSDQTPSATDDPLTADIAFPAPGEYVVGALDSGRALVRAADGSPLVATDSRLGGQLLYYGYLDDSSDFPFDYGYPVFWKRAIDYASGRPSLSSLNRRTGDRLAFETATTVRTPTGTLTGTSVPIRQVGFYEYRDRRVGAGLLSQAESSVRTEPLVEGGRSDSVVVAPGREPPSRLLSLVPLAVAGALVALVLELAYLRFRGDL